jgi:hypothetical protein
MFLGISTPYNIPPKAGQQGCHGTQSGLVETLFKNRLSLGQHGEARWAFSPARNVIPYISRAMTG